MAFAALLVAGAVLASGPLDVLPKAVHDPGVATVEKVLGFDWGAQITTPDEIVTYARALAASAPSHVRLLEYGRSEEGRPLVLLVIASPGNLARWDEVQAGLATLGDARSLKSGQAEELIHRLPAIVWIQCSVHGDEASGADAGLALAYHLAAGRGPEIDRVLADTIVVVDPVENPDGRARFVASVRQATGLQPDPEPASAEHVQPWPGGRVSHDLFDLNRDWFVLSEPESRARVAAMLRYHPIVEADLHEMGAEEGYYFAPPAIPRHPLLEGEGDALVDLLGRGNAAAFDAHGFRYWTREVFDAFYPGYGDSWPTLTGAVGMTFEQASSRGLVTRLKDGTLLTYADCVGHHLLAAFTTCLTTADNRERFLHGWYAFRQTAVTEGARGPARAYVLGDGRDAVAAGELGELLASEGIEVYRVTVGAGGVAAGTVLVPLEQPLGRLARIVLERGESMGKGFEQEQARRDAKRLPDEIYDLTAWSLPLLWRVSARTVTAVPHALGLERLEPGATQSGTVTGQGKVAFLLPWTGDASVRALAQLLRHGVKAAVARKAFSVVGRDFAPGTIVVRRAGNDAGLRQRLEDAARVTGEDAIGVDTGYADRGIDLGSSNVVPLVPPRVAIAWDVPTSPLSAGGLRWAFERVFGYPVSAVRTATLAHADLSHFDVIVLPDAWARGWSYASVLGEDGVKRLRAWVEEGGTLVAVGNGAAFLTQEKVGLLDSKLEKRLGSETPAEGTKPAKGGDATVGPTRAFDYESAIQPGEEEPPLVPGAILRVELDPDSLLSAGFADGRADVLVDSRRVFTPLKLNRGTNVAVYAAADELVRAGFVLPVSREQLPRKAYLMVQGHKRGKVVAFAEDPVSRGLTRSTMLILANAVFFVPGY